MKEKTERVWELGGPDAQGFWLVGYKTPAGFKTAHRVAHSDVAGGLAQHLQDIEDEGNMKP